MPKPKIVSEAPPAPAAAVMLDPRRFAGAGFGWQVFQATVPNDTSADELLNGAFWRRVSPQLKRGDHIAWRTDDLTRHGELIVVALDVATARLELRTYAPELAVPAAALGESERDGFEVKDLGVHDGFGVFRKADNHLMEKNIASADEAWRRVRLSHIPNRNAAAAHVAKAGVG